MKNFPLFILMTLFLQGCVFVAGAAAGAAAIAVVYDHRTLETVVTDQHITNKAYDKLQVIPNLEKNSHVEITTFNQVVLLTGQTTDPALREQIENLVKTVPNIKRIYNQIAVKGPTSSLTRASDSWITTKIKTQMLATKDLKSSNIKVITENGTVYVMGIVSREQAEITVNIARQVTGVQKVVKIFQYTD